METSNNLSRGQKAALTRKANLERRARIAQAQAETQAIVARGTCPNCGSGLRRNLALTGWWQCEQFGDSSFRKDQTKPRCGWQGFTE